MTGPSRAANVTLGRRFVCDSGLARCLLFSDSLGNRDGSLGLASCTNERP